MTFKLACADFTFPLLDHDRVLDLIKLLEFDGVDIGLFEGRSHLQPSKMLRQPERSGKQLASKLENRGLACADVYLQMDPDFVPFAVNHPAPQRRRKARDWFRRTLDYAVACRSRHVSSLPGVLFAEESPRDSFQRCCDELTWRVETAQAADLIFSVEAHIGSIVPTPQKALKLVKSVPGLTLTLDYTHFTVSGMSDDRIEPLIPHASHFHVRGAHKGRLQAAFKNNTIDYARVVRRLSSSKYRGYLGIEYVWTDWQHCNEVDNLSETILWRDFFRRA
jgi:sugar phosphate isomerase/epimerase